MTAVALALYPPRPAEEPVPEVTAPVVVDLDQVIRLHDLLVQRG